MIKLSGSRFTDIMPENLAEQTEIQALAYAVGRQVEKLLAYADGARTYAAIYAVPEKVLDLLAVELRTPSYDENFSIKVKRTLIAESLQPDPRGVCKAGGFLAHRIRACNPDRLRVRCVWAGKRRHGLDQDQ